ncbi:MAG: phosphoribosyltransferase [Betaproteobacteria bacterium]|nr:MAG: phosphoribosyltransferase [Betaproteobacteria bacterium]
MVTIYPTRDAAARLLAEHLIRFRNQHPLILAIPRGAVPMGRIVAEALGGELDIVLVRKLGAPGNPELAVGAIDETGWAYVAGFARSAGADDAYIEATKQSQLRLLQRRRATYTPSRAPIDPSGRVAIVIDDGLATGATMIAALHSVRAKGPARLVCAVPVAPAECLERIRPYADEVVCLQTPADFYAVGQFYRDFRQVEDEEVISLLAQSGTSAPERRA